MPRNSSGVYTPPSGTLAVTDTTISSTEYNDFVNDVASEITASLPRSGVASMQANLPLGGFKITGMANAVASTDAMAYGQFFPAGTKLPFYQAAAPSGWVQDTSVNDKVLRVVSTSGGGTGGAWVISGLTHAHTHSVSGTTGAPSNTDNTTSGGALNLGSATHTHSVSITSGAASTSAVSADGAWRPSYIDMIVAAKS